MRILLGAAVVILALWFTVLRPKSGDSAPAAAAPAATVAGNVNTGAPAQSEPGKLVEKAKQAASTAATAAKQAAGETTATATATPGATATAPATTTAQAPGGQTLPTVPAATLAKLPEDVAAAITAHDVLVLAVLDTDAKPWRPMSDDDRYVRNVLSKVNRYDHTVLVKQVPLTDLTTFGPLLNDLSIAQTPSVVIVDRMLKATVLTGYVDRGSINQAIADARSASTDQLITDPYLRDLNEVCAKGQVSLSRWSKPTIRGTKARVASAKRLRADFHAFQAAVATLPAPAKWRSLKTQFKGVLKTSSKSYDQLVTSARKGALLDTVVMSTTDDTKAESKLDDRFNDAGLTSCATNRRQ
jgi:hypothetical protein